MTNSVVESKRFVVRKSLIGKNVVITFTNKKGDKITYNHDKVYKIMISKLETLPCWEKYKSYKCKLIHNCKQWTSVEYKQTNIINKTNYILLYKLNTILIG